MDGAGAQQGVRKTLHGTNQCLTHTRNVWDDSVSLWECLEPFAGAKRTDTPFGQNRSPY